MKTDIELGGGSRAISAYGLKAIAPATQPKSRRKSHVRDAINGSADFALSSGTECAESRDVRASGPKVDAHRAKRSRVRQEESSDTQPTTANHDLSLIPESSSKGRTADARKRQTKLVPATQPHSGAKSRCRTANKGQSTLALHSGTELSSEGHLICARKSQVHPASATQPPSGTESRGSHADSNHSTLAPRSGTKHANGHDKGASSHRFAAERAKRSEEGPKRCADEGHYDRAPSDLSPIINQLVLQHRRRRFAMKTQQKMDRAMESFVRRNYTEWKPDASDKEREKQNRLVKKIIADAETGIGDPDLQAIVASNSESRSIWDAVRAGAEKDRLRICNTLPVAKWVKSVQGAGLPGLADIIGEAGNLSKYSTEFKLYKRLGFAPYNGLAGSTWKRETWRPRALTKEEWIANPFSGERYGIMYSLADSMFRANWSNPSKEKDAGFPTGHYGELYARRRAHTKLTHEEWTDGHARADALRYMFKKYLRDLWKAWRAANCAMPEEADVELPPSTPLLGS